MTLPELEALTVTELRAHTSYALDHYFNMRGIDSHAHLIEAQFYMRELEQRDSKKIANRDYRMELGIMALILVENIIAIFGIWLGFKEAKEQIAASQTETAAMQELQRSARATADTLTLLQATTSSMNEAIQTQLQLTSRVALDVVFDGYNSLNITNKGRANLLMYGHRVDGLPPVMDTQARSVPPTGFVQFPLSGMSMYTANIPIDRSVVTIPFELYVESDDGTQYIVKCNFVGSRQKNIGNLKTVSMAVSVVKAVWRKRIP